MHTSFRKQFLSVGVFLFLISAVVIGEAIQPQCAFAVACEMSPAMKEAWKEAKDTVKEQQKTLTKGISSLKSQLKTQNQNRKKCLDAASSASSLAKKCSQATGVAPSTISPISCENGRTVRVALLTSLVAVRGTEEHHQECTDVMTCTCPDGMVDIGGCDCEEPAVQDCFTTGACTCEEDPSQMQCDQTCEEDPYREGCPPVCGDAMCATGESCPEDCGCPDGKHLDGSRCVADCTGPSSDDQRMAEIMKFTKKMTDQQNSLANKAVNLLEKSIDASLKNVAGCNTQLRKLKTLAAKCKRTSAIKCGDGKREGVEACDIGANNGKNKGCSKTCTLQPGFTSCTSTKCS